MGERLCRDCNQPADVGVYCRGCSVEIMARALIPQFGSYEERGTALRRQLSQSNRD